MRGELATDNKRQQGALLDASGHSISQIAALVGVSESTISRWRRDGRYQDEVVRLRERHINAVAPLLEHIKNQVVEGAAKALRTLEDALEATDVEGRPDWKTRLAAEGKLRHWMESEYPSKVREMAARASEDQAGRAPTSAVIVVNGGNALERPMSARPVALMPSVPTTRTQDLVSSGGDGIGDEGVAV